MLEAAPKAELMRSLGSLVRGLSALFWGLPLTLLICVKTAMAEGPRPLGVLPAIACMGLLYYGLRQLASFQQQERVWQLALERAQVISIINAGLAPFIFWWNQLPEVSFYSMAVTLLLFSSIFFLYHLNKVIQRLAAMLPDEGLRSETSSFTSLNVTLLTTTGLLIGFYLIATRFPYLPYWAIQFLRILEFSRQYMVIFLILLPVAMTMTLLWKTKEVVFVSVFGERENH